MPLLCVGERRSPTQLDDDGEEFEGQCTSIWQEAPDSILLHIFSFLGSSQLSLVAQTCKVWRRIAMDETLWRRLLRVSLGIGDRPIAPGKQSWREEFKRVHYLTPMVLSETLREHTDEVLHVSFAHRGHLFSTTSKDATLRVWEVGHPTRLKYTKDFRELLAWDFTQFSCFNESDTMILVSSVKTTDYMDRRGYVAILSLIHDFQILRVVTMDPSQLFGAWLDDNTFMGGCLQISLDRFATTVQIEAFEVPEIFSPLPSPAPQPTIEETSGHALFTFSSETASLIKFLTVAAPSTPPTPDLALGTVNESVSIATSHMSAGSLSYSDSGNDLDSEMEVEVGAEKPVVTSAELSARPKVLNIRGSGHEALTAVPPSRVDGGLKDEIGDTFLSDSASACYACASSDGHENYSKAQAETSPTNRSDQTTCKTRRSLIFVTGEFAVALHQLGFKSVPPYTKDSLSGERTPHSQHEESPEGSMVVNYSNNDIHIRRLQSPDKPDNLIDLYGHVTGLCLSEDQRYLFINCRPWIGQVDRTDPWATPDLSPNIEVRIIDLMTLQDLGVRYMGHKGFSPSTMCCFVFLDVSKDYVASGSEDARGYLWDRHYQAQLANFQHESGVVNAVGFSPVDQQYLVTVSDDGTIKVWRSKSAVKLLNLEAGS